MMEKLVLLTVISVAYLCDADRVHFNSDGFAVSGSEESEEVIEDMPPCGEIMSSNSGQFRIERVTSGGTASKYVEFPWVFGSVGENQQCTLTNRSCWYSCCSGLLIGPKVVLSNAFYIYKYRQAQWKVRAGYWNLDTFEGRHPYQERFVKEIIIHPQYHHSMSGTELRNNVALLVVEAPFTLADNIAFICLPPPDLNLAAARCKATGWNHKMEMMNGSRALFVVDVNYIDHDQCQRTLRQNSAPRSDWVLHDSFTCAVIAPRESIGFFSHQLVCIAENHYYAGGLLSWGDNYNNTSLYGYMDVVKFRNWIDQTMRANGFPTHKYAERL